MKQFLPPMLVLALLAAVAVDAAVIKGTPSAFSNGTNILVRWLSDDETGVTGYEIARKAGSSGPFVILTPSLQLKGSNSSYEFVDETAFRASDSFYQYRITPLLSNGKADAYYVVVTHSVSSVRRTWGSIKAMFR